MVKIVFRIEIATLAGTDGLIDFKKLGRLAMLCTQLNHSGKKVIIVSSGAIVLGSARLGLKGTPESLNGKQAAAAVGMAELIRLYQQAFDEFKQMVAQVLLITDDFDSDGRRMNACNTLDKLLQHDIIPVINENDSVSLEDIVLGDNYPLALNVARLIGAQLMVVKTSLEGAYIVLNGVTGEQRSCGEEGIIEEAEKFEETGGEARQEEMKFPSTLTHFMI